MALLDLDRHLEALAALGDPLRRALYRFVGGQDHPVSRNEAASHAGISRSAAAFHLDRLVADGLLATEFRRLSGRQGPGAGRPAKLYRRAPQELAVSLPERRYDLAADLLATAVDTGVGVQEVAAERGARLAGAVAAAGGDVMASAADALAAEGYEPRVSGGQIVLANCPFSALAAEHAELVCGMNLALLDGFTRSLPGPGLRALLDPAEGRCCVRLASPA